MNSKEVKHVRIFLLIYAVSFTLGLIRCIEAVITHGNISTIAAVACLTLIGIRFIFSPEALSQYLYVMADEHDSPVKPRTLTLWHYPVLLLQAALIYSASFILKESSLSNTVMLSAAGAVAINAVWLTSMVIMARRAGPKAAKLGGRPIFWLVNNYTSTLIAIIFIFACSNYGVYFAMIVLMANSIIDFIFTSEWYVLERQQPLYRKA